MTFNLLKVSPGTSTGAKVLDPSDITAIARYNEQNIACWCEAKDCLADADGYVTGITAKLPVYGGSVPQTMAPAASVRAPVRYATTDGQIGIRSGYNADGAVNATRSTLRGTNMAVPAAPWSISILARFELPTTLSYLWSVNDQTNRFGLAGTNTGVVRFYSDITASANAASAAGVNDGLLHLWTTEWNGTNVNVYKDGVVIITSAVAPVVATDRNFRTFSYHSGAGDATAPGGQGAGYWEWFALGKPSAATRAAYKAKALSYHPSMIIA